MYQIFLKFLGQENRNEFLFVVRPGSRTNPVVKKPFEMFARRRKFVASSELTSVKNKSDHALLLIVINDCNNRLTPLVKIPIQNCDFKSS